MKATFYASQGLALLAFGLGVMANLQDSREDILLVWSLSALSYAAHLLLLSERGGAGIAAVNALRFVTAAYSPGPVGAVVFLSVGGALLWFRNTSYGSILPYLAFFSGTTGSFFDTELLVRLFMMLTATLWLSYNIKIRSPVAIFSESVFLLTNLFATVRLLST